MENENNEKSTRAQYYVVRQGAVSAYPSLPKLRAAFETGELKTDEVDYIFHGRQKTIGVKPTETIEIV